jgi:hypothetical protein
VVLLIAALAAIMFLAEGALLDWSALLITGSNLVEKEHGGSGYMMFSVAMTIGRFTGDALIARIGDRSALLWGSLVAIAGFVVLLLAPVAADCPGWLRADRTGRSQCRAGAVPLGRQSDRDARGTGRGGRFDRGLRRNSPGARRHWLRGEACGLSEAFWMLPALLCLVPLSSRVVVGRGVSQRLTSRVHDSQ